MIDPAAARRLAMSLPHVTDESTDARLVFSVGGKGFAWSWNERVAPKKPRLPRLDVLAVHCAPEEKETLLEARPDILFTEPHYNGFPAVLVRLDVIDEAELLGFLKTAWRCKAPKRLLATSQP
jgi:hypothetical protein